MSVLPGGRSLSQALPELDRLMTDPAGYLGEAPLAFGPRRMYGIALMFIVPAVVLLASCFVEFDADGNRVNPFADDPFRKTYGERIVLGVGLFLGGAFWLVWSLMLRGHEMVLHRDGVEVLHHELSIWAPWDLFDVDGKAFVPQSDSPRAGLVLPINPRAIPFIQMRRDGVVLAAGRDVKGPQWSLTDSNEVVLPARYEIASADIGELLLHLGHRLAAELPDPPEAEAVRQADAVPTPEEIDAGADGWIVLPRTRLRFPVCCSRCGGPKDHTLPVPVTSWGDRLARLFLGAAREELPVPVCTPCKEYLEDRQRRGTGLGLAVGSIVGVAAGLAVGAAYGGGVGFAYALGGLVGAFLGVGIGTAVGTWVYYRMPVKVRHYNRLRGTIAVKFENADVARRMLQALRDEQRAAQRGA